MTKFHSSVTSPIFRLVETFNFDIKLGDATDSLKIELYQDTANQKQFRCRIWQPEIVNLKVTEANEVIEAMKLILTSWDTNLHKNEFSCFMAENQKEAIQKVTDAIKDFLVHVTGKDG